VPITDSKVTPTSWGFTVHSVVTYLEMIYQASVRNGRKPLRTLTPHRATPH
jgi:hypothetical protein